MPQRDLKSGLHKRSRCYFLNNDKDFKSNRISGVTKFSFQFWDFFFSVRNGLENLHIFALTMIKFSYIRGYVKK
jgi:hypothetical protein